MPPTSTTRRGNMFGPYLLLQTLGEGEFAKVKLGMHVESGEEVAIKLIRRQSIDNTPRINKIGREISVLRTIRHPNIITLFDVIETERYIGIVIEYASGGELFDHILAHRYLKERDACRLFAQLMSGVHYLHSKHIVHRDLKLENLLLDKNRNIMITDFGFANQFDGSTRDLMSTSCGSPCYAAPELVISDGLYVGTGVDIWSCGVILYAMLAGYLPFDDDPSNPDGDNINQLYNYILATTLVFPEYISADARDLLRMMLVPDPAKRCNMQRIMNHRWLRPYAPMFQYSIEELEEQAIARLNGTVWTPSGSTTAREPRPAPVVAPNPGPPRPTVEEVMPRRHTIWIESVPDSAPSWDTRPLHRQEAEGLVPVSENAMDIDTVEPAKTIEEPEQQQDVQMAEPPMTTMEEEVTSIPATPVKSGNDRESMMESDSHHNVISVPSTGSPVSTIGHTDNATPTDGITPSPSGSLGAKASSVSVRHSISGGLPEQVPASEPKPSKAPEQLVPTIKADTASEHFPDISPTATVSRRAGQHSRARPTTIHGEPMAQNFSYPTPTYHEPHPVPKPRNIPSQEKPQPSPPKVYHHQNHFQQSSPSLLQGPPKLSPSDIPPVPVRNDQNGSTHGFLTPPMPPVPSTAACFEKTHKKGPSASGRLFGFLGNLSKKHGESTTNVSSPKSTHESALADIDQQPPALPQATSSKKPGSINQVFGRYSNSHHNQHNDAQKQAQKGKRRKTLSLVGGSNEHQKQQIHGGTKPPVPMSNILGTSAPSGTGTAQRIMGWLRRKSSAKPTADRPPFDALEHFRPAGQSGSPIPAPKDTIVQAANHVSRAESASPHERDSNTSTPVQTSAQPPILQPSAVLMSRSHTSEERKDPALEAMYQRLPSNWSDSKLRWHSGAVEMSALSSRHPVEIMFEIKKVILALGMEFRVDSDFKIKCVRRRRVHHHDGQKQLSNASVAPDDSVSVMSSNLSMDRDGIWTSAKTGIVNGKKKGGIRTLLWRNSTSLTLSSSPPPPVPPLPNGMISSSPHSSPQARNGTLTPGLPSPGFLHNGASRDIDSDQGVWVSSGMTSEVGLGMTLNGSPSLNSSSNHALPPVAPVSGTQSAIGQSSNTQVATGVPSLASSSTIATSFGPGATSSSSGNTGLEPLYGEDSIDSGEEVRFSIEVCRIKNLMGIYCVDIRRMKGNLWAYKFLYHAVLNTLDLNGKGGYIPTLGAEANNAAAAHAAAAVTNLTIQSSK